MANRLKPNANVRAVIIASQGELTASDNLSQAAETLQKHPGALHYARCKPFATLPLIHRKKLSSSCRPIWVMLQKPSLHQNRNQDNYAAIK
jgi:hypothetical protein